MHSQILTIIFLRITYALDDRQDAASEQQPFYKNANSRLHVGYARLTALKFPKKLHVSLLNNWDSWLQLSEFFRSLLEFSFVSVFQVASYSLCCRANKTFLSSFLQFSDRKPSHLILIQVACMTHYSSKIPRQQTLSAQAYIQPYWYCICYQTKLSHVIYRRTQKWSDSDVIVVRQKFLKCESCFCQTLYHRKNFGSQNISFSGGSYL